MRQQTRSDFTSAVIGTGFVTWDVVFVAESDIPHHQAVGGTCGNVLTILAGLGHDTTPILRLSDDATSKCIRAEFANWGLSQEFLTVGSGARPPVVFQFNSAAQERSGWKHSFSSRCPKCGDRMPTYAPVEVAAVRSVAGNLPSASFFFFDRVSPGALEIARRCREQGGIVFFEPSSIEDPRLFNAAIRHSNIVKYSSDRLSCIDPYLTGNEKCVEIRTLGRDGLAFRRLTPASAPSDWIRVSAFQVEQVADTCGAGDWCSAGLIHTLIESGVTDVSQPQGTEWAYYLERAQGFSAINCLYFGARGAMHHLSQSDLLRAVDRLCSQRNAAQISVGTGLARGDKLSAWSCASCGRYCVNH